MELNELLDVGTDLRIPNHYYELSSEEMARRVSKIKRRLGARLLSQDTIIKKMKSSISPMLEAIP